MKSIFKLLLMLLLVVAILSCSESEQREEILHYATINLSESMSVNGISGSENVSFSNPDYKFYCAISKASSSEVIRLEELTQAGNLILVKMDGDAPIYKGDNYVFTTIVLNKSKEFAYTNSFLLPAGSTFSFFQEKTNFQSNERIFVSFLNANNKSVFAKTNWDMAYNNLGSGTTSAFIQQGSSTRIFAYTLKGNSYDKAWLSSTSYTKDQQAEVNADNITIPWEKASVNVSNWSRADFTGLTISGVSDLSDLRNRHYIEYMSLPVSGSVQLNIPGNAFSAYSYEFDAGIGDTLWNNYTLNQLSFLTKYQPIIGKDFFGGKASFSQRGNTNIDFAQYTFNEKISDGIFFNATITFFGGENQEFILPNIILPDDIKFDFNGLSLYEELIYDSPSLDGLQEVIEHQAKGKGFYLRDIEFSFRSLTYPAL